MRKLIITLAAAGAAAAIAAPASAQSYGQSYYPQTGYGQSYGYQQPYGYGQGYGYHQWGQVHALQMRVDMIQRHIQRLDRADRIRNRTADRLLREARGIEQRLRSSSRYGFNPIEARDVEVRLARLEQRVGEAMNRRFGRGWNNYNYSRYGQGGYGNPSYGDYGHDRDRDDHRGDWDRDDDD